jgi:hypothetical protein
MDTAALQAIITTMSFRQGAMHNILGPMNTAQIGLTQELISTIILAVSLPMLIATLMSLWTAHRGVSRKWQNVILPVIAASTRIMGDANLTP